MNGLFITFLDVFKKANNILRLIILTLLFSFSFAARETFAKNYSDLNQDNVFFNYIQNLSDREIISGYKDGTFRVNNAITRGEISKIIVNSFDLKSDNKNNRFSDLEQGSPFFNYIVILDDLGIIKGYTDGTFKEQNVVTRAEAMKFIVNAMKTKNSRLFSDSVQMPIFTDVDRINPFFSYINSAASIELSDHSRIINGYSDGNFGAFIALNRGEICKIISQSIFYDEEGGEVNPPTSNITFSDTNNPGEVGNLYLDAEIMAVYEVNGDSTNLIEKNPSGNELKRYNNIWEKFTAIVPIEWRGTISKFVVINDEPDKIIAGVHRDYDNLKKFVLIIDLQDAYYEDDLNHNILEYAFVHELAHVITLDSEEISITESLYDYEDAETIERIQILSARLCQTYYGFDGCANSDSLIYYFVYEFWTNEMFTELDEVYSEMTEDNLEEIIMEFYNSYEDDFVSPYAASHPDEDVAESFVYFVFNEAPEQTSLRKNQKMLFFYEDSSLVELRDDIRENLITNGTIY